MENQFFVLLIFIISGVIIGTLFDIFRIRRRLLNLPNFITYIEDIIFWILTGTILTFVIYGVNKGNVRLYQIVALFLGTFIYFISMSRLIFKAIGTIKIQKSNHNKKIKKL